MFKHVLHRDYETYSPVDLKRCGAYVYFEDPRTGVWQCAYAVDEGEVKVWVPGDPIPPEFIECAGNPDWLAVAHNDSFERLCEQYVMGPRYGWPQIPLDRHRCTLAMGYAMALPGALDAMGAALGVDTVKDMRGKRVMMSMAKPRRPRKGEDPKGVYWRDEPENKLILREYGKQDVEAERANDKRLVRLRPFEQRLWELDARINDRGVPVDTELARKALAIVDVHSRQLDREMARVTDWAVSACSNVNDIKAFLKSRSVRLGELLNKKTGVYTETLNKETVAEILAREDLDPACRRVLELRQEGGKASVDKIQALLNGLSPDGRARGLTQFHAANTGRWGGRRFQPQNIVRPDENFDAGAAIDIILRHPTEKAMALLDSLHDTPITCIAYMLRGLIKAEPGKKIVAADYSNIEGTVLAWLAGQQDRIRAFREYFAGRGPDLYLVAAAGIYGLPIDKISKKTHPAERQIGKVAELACGYGGGVGAFQTMAHTYGVTVPDEQAEQIKTAWRQANQDIVRFWYDTDEAVIRAVVNPGKTVDCGPARWRVVGSFLWCQLPSGRALCYPQPKIMSVTTPWGAEREALTFKTVPNVSNTRKIVKDPTNTGKWARISTYGGALVENITQAVARDILAEGMVRLEAANYPIILTVHDEAVSEVAEGFGSAREYEQIMAELPPWARGLPVAAAGFESERYRK